ncbi:hypothetical protein [Streptomyces violaceusniger]|uniref:hypothetical protein n=1 Tax=Streptomyces violaceusniger TaxID=68280 RepID=UPI00382922B6
MTSILDTTLVLNQLRQWKDEDGPEQWQAAWDRALELLEPLWPTKTLSWDGVILADGGAALATALYLIAREQNIGPADVHRAQVRALIDRAPGETDSVILPRWENRLRALGHDLEDPADPVAARWRQLRKDHSPPDDLPGHVREAVLEDHSAHRWGRGFLEGLRRVLAPVYEDRLQI